MKTMNTMTTGIASMKKYIALIIAGTMLLLSACDSLLTDAKDETAGILPDLYIAGGNDPVGPCIYKNSQRIDLEREINPSYQYQVNAVCVYNNDVYAAGAEYNTSNWAVCYWKNGTKRVFIPFDGSVANSISVSGNNVYMAGTNGPGSICIWYNGLKLGMPWLHSQGGFTNAVVVKDGKIHVTGNESGSPMYYLITKTTAIATDLYDPMYGNLMPSINAMLVTDGHVYIGGSWNGYPAFWHNGTITVLDPAYGGYVSSICYNNGNLYSAGSGYSTAMGSGMACYWVNDNITPHFLVREEPVFNGSFARSFHIDNNNKIVWMGYLSNTPSVNGFVYDGTVFPLTSVNLPLMLVTE